LVSVAALWFMMSWCLRVGEVCHARRYRFLILVYFNVNSLFLSVNAVGWSQDSIVGIVSMLQPGRSGPWSPYTKPWIPTPQFLHLQLRLIHKSSVCINNSKPTKMVNSILRHFITTTWMITLLFSLTTYI
jgi:hypothetical protein